MPKRRFHTPILLLAIFAVAMALRIPACHESFWVDELHTTWCVWGSLGEVAPRAVMGNQSPVYFWGIWLWKQVAGETEIGLRMSSVLATALTACLSAWAVKTRTQSWIGGAVAGLMLAVESNAIFFGTELRPYAWVMLMMSCWIALDARERINTRKSHKAHAVSNHQWRKALVAILAIAVQPTALIAFTILVALSSNLLAVSAKRLPRKPISLILAGLAMLGITMGLSSKTWQQREMWSSFAKMESWQDMFSLWDWPWLALVPAIILLINHRKIRACEDQKTAGMYLLVVGLMTSAVAALSFLDIVHLWHRRYMIAALPLMATAAGMAIAGSGEIAVGLPASGTQVTSSRPCLLRLILAATVMFGLTYWQSTLPVIGRMVTGQSCGVLTARGEDWRSAVAWANDHSNRNSIVAVDSGLIEAQNYLAPANATGKISADVAEYLTYPVRSIYQLDRLSRPIRTRDFASESNQTAIVRFQARNLTAPSLGKNQVWGFGGVSVMQRDGDSIDGND